MSTSRTISLESEKVAGKLIKSRYRHEKPRLKAGHSNGRYLPQPGDSGSVELQQSQI